MAYAVDEEVRHEKRVYKSDLLPGHYTYRYEWANHDCRLKIEWVNIHDPRQVRTFELGQRKPFRQVVSLCFSPDSTRVAALESDRITTIDIASGRGEVTTLKDDTAMAISWLSDNEQAYLTDEGLWKRPAAGGDEGDLVFPIRLRVWPAGDRRDSIGSTRVNVSPSGQYMAVYAQPSGNAGPVYVIDAVKDRILRLTFFSMSSLCRDDVSWSPDESALILAPYFEYTSEQMGRHGGISSDYPAERCRPTILVDLRRLEQCDVTDKMVEIMGDKRYDCPRWSEDGNSWIICMGRRENQEKKWVQVWLEPWRFEVHPGQVEPPSLDRRCWKEIYRRTGRLDARSHWEYGVPVQSPFSNHLALHSLDKGAQQTHLTLYEIPSIQPTTRPATMPATRPVAKDHSD